MDDYKGLRERIEKIKERDGRLIVDLGFGAVPSFDANILIDKYIHEAVQRGVGQETSMMYPHQIVIQGDAHDLWMFEDKEVDILIANAILEHLENPNKALREWERVAHRGYIEIPNRKHDMFIRGREDRHLWACEWHRDNIRLVPRKTIIPLINRQSFGARLLRRIFTVFGWKTCFWIFWENNIPIRATKEKLDGLVEVKKDGILDGLGDG